MPEWDDYLRPAEAARRFAAVPQARVVAVEGGRHLWVGETLVRRALDETSPSWLRTAGRCLARCPVKVELESEGTADATDPADTDTDTDIKAQSMPLTDPADARGAGRG